MGWFSATKKTYVSSVAYPLGEDGAERTDMLQYTVLNSILQGQNTAESITQSYLKGQGMSLRRAFGYARDHYVHGLAQSAALFMDQPNADALRTILQAQWPGAAIEFLTTVVGSADFEWWAEQYLATSYGYDRTSRTFVSPPVGVAANANVAYDLEPDGSVRILLMNADGATTALSFRPDGYQKMANYVHSAYQTVREFGDAGTLSTRAADAGEANSTRFTSTTVERAGEIQVTTLKIETVVAAGVATVTTTPTITVTSRPQYFIYRMGTGKYPALDALSTSTDLVSPYFPSIVLRADNLDWTRKESQSTAVYKTSEKLLSKVGLKLKDLAKSVNTNQSINDIDYAFVIFGVRLNSDAPESMQYLFRYFSYLRDIGTVNKAQFTAWETNFKAKFPDGIATGSSDFAGTPPTNVVEIYSAKQRENHYDVKLQWQYIDTQLYAGQVKPGAKRGTVTVAMGSGVRETKLFGDMVMDSSLLTLRRQVDDNTYEELTVAGLTYENFIYQGKSVIITAADAMNNADEKGFIIPLNQEVLRAMPMVQMTNLSYQCMHMVFNCYKVVKQKWYQTGWFKALLVIIAIVLAVFFPPAGVTMLAAVIGAAVAVSIMVALIIAATVYVLAMMVLMSIIMKIATNAFGPTWGPIIVAVLAIMTMNYQKTGSVLGTQASNTALISAPNIIQATSSLASAYVSHELKGISKELAKLSSDYTTGMAKIEDLTKELLGTHLDMVDVTGFTNASYQLNYEMPTTFLNRTLLTGNDICTITSGLVENFADVGLQLPTTG